MAYMIDTYEEMLEQGCENKEETLKKAEEVMYSLKILCLWGNMWQSIESFSLNRKLCPYLTTILNILGLIVKVFLNCDNNNF